jgi:flagellar hook-length control protein FliK
MQTSPVQNQASLLSAPAPSPTSRQSDASITPFNQMLSREMADRRAAETPKAPESRAADNSQPAKAPADPKDAKATKVTDKEKPADDKDPADGVTTAAADQAPADMLALVANLNQASPQAAAARDVKTPVEDAAGVGVPATKPDGKASLAAVIGETKSAAVIGETKSAAVIGETKSDGKTKTDPDALNAAAKPMTDLAGKSRDAAAPESASLPARTDFAAEIKETIANATVDTTPGIQPLQQAALQAAQPAIAHLQDKLTPAVGTPAWDQALGQKVVWMVAGEQQSASLTLNPPDLGPLQVVLNVNHSTATATFSAAQPEVRQALEAALPKLREMLGDAGIQLGQASVNSGAANQQGMADRQAAHGAQRSGHVDNGVEAPVRIGRVQPAVSGQGLVDTFV